MQKGIGGVMGGALIETEARTILQKDIRQGISETERNMALKMLQTGKLAIVEIAEYTGLSVTEVEQLAKQ